GKKKVGARVEAKLGMPLDIPGLSELADIKVEVKETRMFGADIILDVRRIKAVYDVAIKLSESEKDAENPGLEGE
ncbi:MAG: hypothetical protein II399_05225, partial [Lachnospiraceae bacterium]|nr:hypothetical protein [Lachnospiraceae bacterium]